MSTPPSVTPRLTGGFRRPSIPPPAGPTARWTMRRVVMLTVVALGVALVLVFLYRFRHAFLGAFVGIVLAAAARPPVRWLTRRGLRRDRAAFLVFATLCGAAVGFLVLALPLIFDQITVVAAKLPGHYLAVRDYLTHSSSRLVRQAAAQLPAVLNLESLAPMGGRGFVWASARALVGGLASAGAVLLMGFYWTIDGEAARQAIARLMPLEQRTSAREFLTEAESRLGGFVRGQLLSCLAVGTLAYLSFLIIGVPNALVFGLIAAVTEIIPIVGPTLGAAPAVLVMLPIDPTRGLLVVGAALIIQLLENYLITPRVMGRSTGVHPLLCLLAIIAFGSLFGLLGVFLAIPITVVLKLAFERMVRRDRQVTPPSRRNRHSALRYQARTLASDVGKVSEGGRTTSEELEEVAEEIEVLAGELDALLATPRQGEPR